jgi:hypothetical protein
MESFDDLLTMLERPAAKSRPVKRKWREIEAVKERQRLKKELEDIGALNAIPFSATARIGLEEATLQIENWISPKVVP